MESECRVAWADLRPELVAVIFNYLQQPTDIIRFRMVCRSWRSSLINLKNNPPLFPLSISSFSWSLIDNPNPIYDSRPNYLIANAVYHLRSNKSPKANWIVSVQEPEPGKLLLCNALTLEPIPESGCRIPMPGWSLTRIALYHSFSPSSPLVDKSKVVFDNSGDPTAVFKYGIRMCAFRRCLSPKAGQFLAPLLGAHNIVKDFVNFNGRIYAIDARSDVYVLDRTRKQLLTLACVGLTEKRLCPQKRFAVSEGDLYLCLITRDHEILVYKLVMDDINNATWYYMEKVEDLGGRLFVINKDCSFSVSPRDLPPYLLGNCIIVSGSTFPSSCNWFCRSYHVYCVGGKKTTKMVRNIYSAFATLFEPPLWWINQLEALKEKEKEEEEKQVTVSMPRS